MRELSNKIKLSVNKIYTCFNNKYNITRRNTPLSICYCRYSYSKLVHFKKQTLFKLNKKYS